MGARDLGTIRALNILSPSCISLCSMLSCVTNLFCTEVRFTDLDVCF